MIVKNQVGHNLGLYHDGPCAPRPDGSKDTDPFCRFIMTMMNVADNDEKYDQDLHDQQTMKD